MVSIGGPFLFLRSALRHFGRRRIVAGAGGVFQGLDRAEKATQSSFVARGIRRIGQPLFDRSTAGLLLRLAGLGQGQLRPDVELEGVQEGVVAGRGAHLSSRRDVGECLWRAMATWSGLYQPVGVR